MVFLSKSNIQIIKRNEDFFPKLWSEIFSAFILNEYIESENIILDDKPDFYNLSKTSSYEVVQCDLDEDLNRKYIMKSIFENNSDYDKTIETLKKDKKVKLSKYIISKTEDGLVGSIMPSESGNSPYYYLPIFRDNIEKKINKLNKNYYSLDSHIFLVILSISRFKENDDAEKIFDLFKSINYQYKKRFENLFLITTSGLYFLENDNLRTIKISEEDFNQIIIKVNNLISNVKNKESLYTEHPEIAREWHPTMNGCLQPFDVSPSSNKKVWWKCDKGHDFEGIIYNRVSQNSKCTICANKKVLKGFNDLKTTHPSIANEWDYEKNFPLTPSQIRCGTDKKYWWVCPKCHISYQASPNIRTSQNTGCPYCTGRKVLAGVNDLLTKRPDIALEWNYEKNGGLLPTMVTEKSGRKVWWKCSKGHEWQCKIAQRTIGKGTQCPECQSGLNTSFPELAIYYYIKKCCFDAINRYKNSSLKITEIDIFIPSLKAGVEYNGCHYHNKNDDDKKRTLIEENKIKLISVVESKNYIKPFIKNDCIYINHRFSYSEIDFAIKSIFEILKINYDFNINVENDSLEIYKLQSKILNDNSLGNKRPDLINEWNWEKNKNLSPFDFSYNSHFSVWWKCSKGHEWKSPINNRAKANGTKCPYCSNNKILKGYNDFASLHPALLEDWDYEKNTLNPFEIAEKSNKIVFWKCHICGYEWKSPPAIRIKKQCPGCVKQEHKISVKNLDNGLKFESITDAALWLGDIKFVSGISLACRGKRKTAYGYRWGFDKNNVE